MPSPFCRIVAFLALLSLVFSAFAHEYKAPYDGSHWKTNTSKVECSLTHTIPGYGKAIFSQSSHEHQKLVVDCILDRLHPGKATLNTYPQRWKINQAPTFIAKVPVKPGLQPITMKSDEVYRVLENLDIGHSAVFIITPANTASKTQTHKSDKIVLMPAGFEKPYKEYLHCISQMIPHTFNDLKEIVLHFESGSAIISKENERKLKELAEFVRADGKIRRIDIAGHSDRKGSFQANNYLANQRIWAVKDYLVQFHGIKADMLTLKDYADKKPIATNKTAEGRAKNRRVVITIYR
ncbi:MAG: OmpA family protein [Proteobacteria bacterium]|nr:OmpA family protein [Pseudomonadota bacterium]